MKAYVGQTRSADLVAKLVEHGIGECTQRGELHSRRRDPWFYDNGAYRDWQAKQSFDLTQFMRDMRHIHYSRGSNGKPDFVVAPDIVAAGVESLQFSRSFDLEIGELPKYLAVQDGMGERDVERVPEIRCGEFAGIFVGGTTKWKLATAASWAKFAHKRKMQCHVGRVGTPARVRWARSIGADSIDSCLPIMFAEHLQPFLDALEEKS